MACGTLGHQGNIQTGNAPIRIVKMERLNRVVFYERGPDVRDGQRRRSRPTAKAPGRTMARLLFGVKSHHKSPQ